MLLPASCPSCAIRGHRPSSNAVTRAAPADDACLGPLPAGIWAQVCGGTHEPRRRGNNDIWYLLGKWQGRGNSGTAHEGPPLTVLEGVCKGHYLRRDTYLHALTLQPVAELCSSCTSDSLTSESCCHVWREPWSSTLPKGKSGNAIRVPGAGACAGLLCGAYLAAQGCIGAQHQDAIKCPMSLMLTAIM